MTEKIETPVNKSLTGESAEPSGAQLGSIAQEGKIKNIDDVIELKNEMLKRIDELIAKIDLDYNLWFKDRQYVLKELIIRIVNWYCGLDDNIRKVVIYGVSVDGEKYKITLEP